MEEKPVISASRTKDLVRCAPELLARMLEGTAPVRFARIPSLVRLSPLETGALVLWTKDPRNIVERSSLRSALSRFSDEGRGIIILNLTVTGLGGSMLEPGIPPADAVLKTTHAALRSGFIQPEAVILRYDPVISAAAPGARIGNMDPGMFRRIAGEFAALGVRRIKVSSVDYRYAHVPRRLALHGIEPVDTVENAVHEFIEEMKQVSEKLDMRLDVCCHPAQFVTEETAGCVDGPMINRLLERSGSPHRVTVRLHNEVGRQRKTCRCTYSRDIGQSPGVPSCFSGDGACLYCYSQRSVRGPFLRRLGILPPEPVSQ